MYSPAGILFLSLSRVVVTLYARAWSKKAGIDTMLDRDVEELSHGLCSENTSILNSLVDDFPVKYHIKCNLVGSGILRADHGG